MKKSVLTSLNPNIVGAIWMIGSIVSFLISNAFIKVAGKDLPTCQMVFLRTFFQTLILLPFVVREGFDVMYSKNVKNYIFRIGFGILSLFFMFFAFAHAPFATATSLVFTRPLFTIVVAFVLLNEKVGWGRAVATIIGFFGILIVVQPKNFSFSLGEIAGLCSAFFLSLTHIYIQKLSRTEKHLSILIWFTVVSCSVMAVPSAVNWVPPSVENILCAVSIALFATMGQYCVIKAYQVGKMTVVSPLEYLQLLFSAVVGFVFFDETVTWRFMIGALIIVSAGFYIVRKKERK